MSERAPATLLYGAGAAAEPYRGLHTSLEEVEQLLSRVLGESTLWHGERNGETECHPSDGITPLSWLAHTFDLSPFDVDIILIALAPEFDLRYERLYAYLQDDVTRKWPSVDLVLNLLCPSLEAKLKRRKHFAPAAPLL